ncbi:unnamed protein product [Schistosoma curassoni]|uniref:Protein kinase domain-containing protein n=1 Tax=Schistosoma curassoni TaxID=6186 RepID=A0A183KHB6_9TREM|nr:unnamed protein product [Schistosoma curassoni]
MKRRHPSLLINELFQNVHELYFSFEFEEHSTELGKGYTSKTICFKSYELEKANQLTCHVAVHPKNYYLNRYNDILAYDQTRIVLNNTSDQNPVTFSEVTVLKKFDYRC